MIFYQSPSETTTTQIFSEFQILSNFTLDTHHILFLYFDFPFVILDTHHYFSKFFYHISMIRKVWSLFKSCVI